MSTNCLVTKLKGVVDNSNLIKLGEVRLMASPTADVESSIGFLGIPGAVPFIIKTTDGGDHILYEGNRYSQLEFAYPNNNKKFTLEAGNYGVSVLDKYQLISIKGNIVLQQLDYCNNLTGSVIIGSMSTGNMSVFERIDVSNLQGLFHVQSRSVTGNLSSIANTARVKEFDFSCALSGDIAVLGKNAACNKFQFINCPNIGGNAEDLVEQLWLYNKRSSSTILTVNDNTGIKFHNTKLAYSVRIDFSDADVKVYKNSDSSLLATYNGSTWTYNG